MKYIQLSINEFIKANDSKDFKDKLINITIKNDLIHLLKEKDYIDLINIDKVKSKRIGNIEFKKACCLLDDPKIISYHINIITPNPYYNRENDYEKQYKNGDYYYIDEKGYWYHESCFKNKESKLAIAKFEYINDEWHFSYIENRPLTCLKNEEEKKDFQELIKYGFEQLENFSYSDE